MASALACKYAVTGDEAMKREALQVLDRAAGMRHENQEPFDYYVRRIRHRLDTHEIITRAEFDRRFPDQAPKKGN